MSNDPFLAAVLNLSRFHREHEEFYATHPREQAVELQRHSRTFKALADHWNNRTEVAEQAHVPYAGSEDLNAAVATQLDGVLFMEGADAPAEILRITDDLRAVGNENVRVGEWLASAMTMTWDAATALLEYPPLADLLGERHRIIANDRQAADMSRLAGQLLLRASEVLDRLDFNPDALRRDLRGTRIAPALLFSVTELIDRAADLLSDSAGLVHENERRWRTFRARVEALVAGT